jgi:hypothetical protein
MAEKEKEKEIDWSKCKIRVDKERHEIIFSCPSDVFDEAVKIKPRRVTFELLEKEGGEKNV